MRNVILQTVLDDGVDYVKLAEAMGATGYRATNREEFNKALKKALASDTPVVIDCIINSDDKVWPMVAPGEAISSAFTGDDLKRNRRSNDYEQSLQFFRRTSRSARGSIEGSSR